jgi:hypothetical protein
VPLSTFIAATRVSLELLVGQLVASGVLLLSGHQDLRLRSPLGAAFWFFLAMVFAISALITAIEANLWAVWICAAVLCFGMWMILRWILRSRSSRNS